MGSTENIRNGACPGEDVSTCCLNDVYINPTYAHNKWKFVVAHEIGHCVHGNAYGYLSKDYDAGVPTDKWQCRCDHLSEDKSHCYQSREYVDAAAGEGLAHAFASRVFNNWGAANSTFVYYKAFKNTKDGDPIPPPLARDAFSAQRWMEQYCVATDRGVEWDWNAFIENVAHTDRVNSTSPAKLYEILKETCWPGPGGGQCPAQKLTWPRLRDAAKTVYGSDTDPTARAIASVTIARSAT